MKSKLLALAVLAGGAVFGQVRFSVGIGTPYAVYPPPPAYVVAPPCPGPGYTWMDGYWAYEGPRRLWRSGYWAPPVYARGYYYGGGPRYYRERAYRGRGYWEHGGYGRGGWGRGYRR